jgi:hypothetical protein
MHCFCTFILPDDDRLVVKHVIYIKTNVNFIKKAWLCQLYKYTEGFVKQYILILNTANMTIYKYLSLLLGVLFKNTHSSTNYQTLQFHCKYSKLFNRYGSILIDLRSCTFHQELPVIFSIRVHKC